MSLTAWEQQALDSMTDRLAGSDPNLVGLLTTFTRMASGEEMPASEAIRADSRRAIRCSRCKRRHPGRDNGSRHPGPVHRRVGLQWVVLLLWLLTTVTLITVTLILNHGGAKSACPGFLVTACADSAPAHSSRPTSHKTVTNQAPHPRAVRTEQAEPL